MTLQRDPGLLVAVVALTTVGGLLVLRAPSAEHQRSKPAEQPAPARQHLHADGYVLIPRPRYEVGLALHGSVEVYSAGSQELLGVVESSDPDDFFGVHIARIGDIDGDGVDDFAVGAPASDLNRTDQVDSGRVIVYSGADLSVLHDVSVLDKVILGRSVAGVGDVDGDGVPDFAAAAYGHTPMGGYNEEVFVFSGADGSLQREIESWLGADLLGWAMTGVGDLNGDGIGEFAVSAPYGRPDQDLSDRRRKRRAQGAVYIFEGRPHSDSVIHEYSKDPLYLIRCTDPDARFGLYTMAGHDLTGDGVSELVVVSRMVSGAARGLDVAESFDILTGERISSEPHARYTAPPGDLNHDLLVDASDLTMLLNDYGDEVDTDMAFSADIDRSGRVDVEDLTQLLNNYGKTHALDHAVTDRAALTEMAHEVALRPHPGEDENCGRPIRTIGWPGTIVWCKDVPTDWTTPFESINQLFYCRVCPEACGK